jgi:hypothetical protein
VDVESAEDFCRAVEAHLCRKNDGHLIRVVGPAFEQVCGWARQGVPLAIACHGIDRYFERYYAKGRRRRPVRVESCEADILDAFDEWRRAVGVPALPEGEDSESPRRAGSLAAHLERVTARLTVLRSSASPGMAALVDPVVHELDTSRSAATGLRGDARQVLLARLRKLDVQLLIGARAQCAAGALEALTAQADSELAPFRTRMTPPAYADARERGVDRLVRQHWGLPTLAFEAA